MHHEQQTGKKIDSQVVTWRGIVTKVSSLPLPHHRYDTGQCLQNVHSQYFLQIMASPFEARDGYETSGTAWGSVWILSADWLHRFELDATLYQVRDLFAFSNLDLLN